MISIKKILFPTDFSECANAALAWALMFAKNFDAELVMFHAVVLHGDDVGEEVYSRFPDFHEVIQTVLDNAGTRLETSIPDPGRVAVSHRVQRGFSAAEEVVNFGEEIGADLIVMGTHGRRGLQHLFLGSVTEKVMRAARCPVLTVRHEGRKDYRIAEVDRIILPVDFSKHSKVAARYAATIAKLVGVQLVVTHVIDRSIHPSFYSIGKDSIFELDPELQKRAEDAISEFMREAGCDIEYVGLVLEGRPGDEIARLAAETGSPLVVISSHGAGALEKLMMGSTTERVVRRAQCPVLIVKMDERDFVS